MVSPVRRDGPEQRPWVVQLCRRLDEGRNAHTRILHIRAGGHASLSLVLEMGGKWPAELNALAKARAREVPFIMQARAEAAWRRRWSNILACSEARVFASSLVEIRPASATGDMLSVNEVLP